MLKPCRNRAWLLAITGVGLALRFWGIRWGTPARIDLHPDELDYVMKHALGILARVEAVLAGTAVFDRQTLDPVFLNYPGFLMYLITGVGLALRQALGVVDNWPCFVAARMIVATFGAATVPAVYALARRVGADARGALLAALWMALLPLGVWESHAAITDIPMTFFVVVTVWAATRLIAHDGWRDYGLAGAALGLAVGMKYTAAIAAVAIVTGALLGRHPWRRTLVRLPLCGALAVAVCFCVTPYSFLRFHDLLAAMAYENSHTHSMHRGFSVYATTGWWMRRWLYQLLAAWPFSFGVVLYAAVLAGGVWSLWRWNRGLTVALVFAALFFAVTGSWTFTPLRYYLPLLAIGTVLAGRWMGDWIGSPARVRRAAGVAAAALTAMYTGVFGWQTTARYGNDTRMQAGRWLDDHATPGSRIVLAGWARYHGVPADPARFDVHLETEAVLLQPEKVRHSDVVSISSLLYERHYRHGVMSYVEAYDWLRDPGGEFDRIARFAAPFLNKDFYMRLDPMFEGYFVSPTIELYRPKTRATSIGVARAGEPSARVE